jgi:hypothetical protein
VICLNTVDKGDRREFGVKAVDKGVRDETTKLEERRSKIERRRARLEKRKSKLAVRSRRCAGAERKGVRAGYRDGKGSERRFHDRAGYLHCTVPI